MLALVLGYFAPFQAAADWTTITETHGVDETLQESARVTNPEGYSLDVQRDSNGIVRGAFSLNRNAAPLDERSCPTIRVDEQGPRAVVMLEGPCQVEGQTARFTLGTINDGVIRSTLLTELMNGKRIFVWHHLRDRGYRETQFTLRGSMQALMQVIGTRVRVLPQ